MSTHRNQHIVPKTYLSHWVISDKENFVFVIDCADPFKRYVQRKGISDKIFTSPSFYNYNHASDPLIIEKKLLADNIEPIYGKIMKLVNAEESLPEKTIWKLMQWLFVSDWRNPSLRNRFADLGEWIVKTAIRMKEGPISPEIEEKIDYLVHTIAKTRHLDIMLKIENPANKAIAMNFFDELVKKKWRILKAPKNFGFWTSDNPGFSVNRTEVEHRDSQFFADMVRGSVIYFPLSPFYCLELNPTNEAVSNRLEVEYVNADLLQIDFINRGVFHTKNRLIISKDRESLEGCVKWKK